MKNILKNKYFRLVASIIIAELAGIIGSLYTMPQIRGWYAGLVKPSISPPNWVFGPVWTTLFLLMGISLYLLWQSAPGFKKREAIEMFFIQLFLNITWSIVFFGLESPFFAFFVIMALWISIFACMAVFYKISKTASYLFIPYFLWVSFALVLNFMFYIIN